MKFEPYITRMGARSRSRYAQKPSDEREFFTKQESDWRRRRENNYNKIQAKGAPYLHSYPCAITHAPYEPFSNESTFEVRNLPNGGPKPLLFDKKSMYYINECLKAEGQTAITSRQWRSMTITRGTQD